MLKSYRAEFLHSGIRDCDFWKLRDEGLRSPFRQAYFLNHYFGKVQFIAKSSLRDCTFWDVTSRPKGGGGGTGVSEMESVWEPKKLCLAPLRIRFHRFRGKGGGVNPS